jgi:glycosyltransferase involved in cell wall biosynthesis
MSVSVVIPAYNSRFLQAAIESVMAQTRAPSEILLVDGSPETTLAELSSYRHRISYYHQPPRGVSAARNFGIQKAQGRYIAFLDADDLWLPEKLEKQVDLLDRYPQIGFCFSTVWNLVEDTDSGVPREPFFPPELLRWMAANSPQDGAVSGSVYGLLLEVNCIATSSLLIRRDLFEAVGLFDESLKNGEDYDFELRLARSAPAFFTTPPTSRYRVHTGGLSGGWSGRSELFYRSNLTVLESHCRLYPSPEAKRALARTYAGYSLHCLKLGDRKTAAAYARRSLEVSPSLRALKCYVEAQSPRAYKFFSAWVGAPER